MGVRNDTVVKHTGPPGPVPAGVWARAWFRVSQPFAVAWGRCRAWWLLARGERKVHRWWRPRTWPMNIIYTVLFLVYALWIAYSVWPKGSRERILGPVVHWLPNDGWQQALTALGLSAATVVAAMYFVVWRFRRARRRYLRKAKKHPDEMVKPGTIIDRVVGRDELCDSLVNDLRDREQRRPRVIVGSIGVGKTALLVHLTGRLARKGITPVVLQLRDVQVGSDFDFERLAETKFCDEMQRWVFSRAEAEKVWQRLRYTQDHVVVLADGLEDALKGVEDRDSRIRKAIADAHEAKLPLVVTSRPQKSLESLIAARTVLDPLSEEDALRYVSEGSNWRTDKRRMDWVVEAADVAESPLYLNIAKDLELRGLLERIVGGGADENSDPRDQDVWSLRYDLLDAWVKALEEGHLYPEQPLSTTGRRLTVEWLSVLACVTLRTNSTFVRYDMLTMSPGEHGRDGSRPKDGPAAELVRQRLTDHLEGELGKVENPSAIDARLAGSWASRLGLVEERDEGVRFHHSVLQAFLASRCIGPLIHREPVADRAQDPHAHISATPLDLRPAGAVTGRPPRPPTDEQVQNAYFDRALQCPGRELGLALVFYSRSEAALTACKAERGQAAPTYLSAAAPSPTGDCPIHIVRSRLWKCARTALEDSPVRSDGTIDAAVLKNGDVEQDPRIRALEIYSAALDIDSFHHQPDHRAIVQEIHDRWKCLDAYNDRAMDAPKKALIRRIGMTGRLLSSRRALPPGGAEAIQAWPAYDLLFDIACHEPSHEVRFTIAEALGEGGDDAFLQLGTRLSPPAVGRATSQGGEGADPHSSPLADALVAHLHKLRVSEPATADETLPPHAPAPDRPTSAPGTTRTERLLRRERMLILANHRHQEEADEQEERTNSERVRRGKVLSAWLAPMLVQSCSYTRHERTPYEVLSQWMKCVSDHDIDLDLQVALAQGFRRAANRRTPPTESTTTRDFLMEQAWEMLRHTRYWYARLVLVHALTLWALPDDVAQPRPRRGHGARPARQVRQWLERTNACDHDKTIRTEHPLVKAAATLARRTLQSQRPDRFLWIDESGMASQIGSESNSPREPRLHNMWLPPSRGWSTLDPGAQQLLGDVLVLLPLTEERGDRPEDARLRLRRADRADPPLLPPCLARDRAPLAPAQSLPSETSHSLPGSNCADGCPFELCPYPPKGPQCHTELNEAFCIHQRSLLNRLQFQAWRFLRFRRRAPWQRRVSVASLRTFWDEMGDRARDEDVREASHRHLDRR